MWSIDGQNPRKLLLSKPSDYVIQLHGLRQMGAYIPKKTALELSNIMRIRIYDSSNGSLQVTIPRQMVNQLGTENVYGVWTTSKGRLYLELTDENPHISTVNEEKRQTIPDIFSVRIPDDVGKSFKEGDRVTREIRDGKLYVHKKEAAV